jgi:hypothetical protein
MSIWVYTKVGTFVITWFLAALPPRRVHRPPPHRVQTKNLQLTISIFFFFLMEFLQYFQYAASRCCGAA